MGKKSRTPKASKTTTPATPPPSATPFPSRYFAFQPNKYSAEANDKTTFLFGEITTLDMGTQMIQVKLKRNATSLLPFETEEYTEHQIKIMKLVSPTTKTDFILLEYIDTFNEYMVGADMYNNKLWNDADELKWNSEFSHLTDETQPHPNITAVEVNDISGVNEPDTSPTQ